MKRCKMLAVVSRFVSLAIFIIFLRFSAASEFQNVLENPELKEALTILQLENIFQGEIPSSVNESCRNQLVLYADGVQRKKTWALQMLDASWKIPAGISAGNLNVMGMYDQCLSVDVTEENDNFFLRGRHCTVFFQLREFYSPKYPRFSFCLPAVCDESTLDAIIQEIMNNSTIFQKAGVEYRFSTCSKIDSNRYSTKDVLAMSTLFSIVAVLLFISICDVIDDYFGKLSAFTPIRGSFKYSIYRNAGNLFKKTELDEFPVINGLRGISMLWIMTFHDYISLVLMPFVNFVDIFYWYNSWYTLFFLSGIHAVDAFFTISGFLVSYNFVKDMSNGKKFHLFSFYLRRYCRLTPLLLATLLCNILLSKIGSGPSWDWSMDIAVNSCYEKLWAMLFYVQNFFFIRDLCMMHAWHLATEMQLYWLSPFFLHALVKKPKLGYFTLGIAVIFSVSYQAITIINHEIPTIIAYNLSYDEMMKSFEYVYVMPSTRIGPYAIGMIFGYLMATKQLQLSQVYIRLGWILANACFFFVTFLTNKIAAQHYKRDIVLEILFNCLSHPAWGFGVAWIIYANSINNNQGLLGKLLSSHLLTFLSKLSYGFYLIHVTVQYSVVSYARTSSYWSPFYETVKRIEHLIAALILAFFVTILFEMPAMTLVKSFDKRKKIVAVKSE